METDERERTAVSYQKVALDTDQQHNSGGRSQVETEANDEKADDFVHDSGKENFTASAMHQ